MRKLMATIVTLLLLSTGTLILAQRVTGEALFQQGLDLERGKRDIRAAITIYERILKEFPSNGALVAKTLVQLGDCHEKLGNEAKAQEYYQQVLTKYPEETDVAARARAHVRAGTDEPAVTRNEFVIPSGLNLAHRYRNGVEISPNGSRIAFVAAQPSVERPAPNPVIYLKSQFGEATPIPATVGGFNPFFSPDARSLGFFRIRNNNNLQAFDLLKISLDPLAESPVQLFSQPLTEENDDYGASWGSNGRIVLGSFQDGLKWLPAETGGQPQPLTQLDSNAEEAAHRFPHFLPDGSAILFTVLRYSPTDPNLTRAQIWVYSFKTGKRNLLLENGTDARSAPNDSLIFAREGRLYAVRFDPKALTVSGTPVEAVDGDAVTHSKLTGAAQYGVSSNGTLVFAPGSVEPPIHTSVAWVDEKSVTRIELPERSYSSARVSPDGKWILISETGAISLYDVSTGNLTSQFTSPGDALSPATWSADSEHFAFSSAGNGPIATYVKAIHSPTVTRLLPRYFSPTWAPDGRLAVLGKSANSDRVGIYLVSPDDPNNIEPLVQNSMFDLRDPVFSADGSWLAYVAADSGSPRGSQQIQLYARRFPVGEPVLIGRADAISFPDALGSRIRQFVWSRDGLELFGINGRNSEWGVIRNTFGPSGSSSFNTVQIAEAGQTRLYLSDVASGGRFLMMVPPHRDERTERSRKIFPTTLRVVTNWSAELKRTWGKPTSTPTVTQAPTPALKPFDRVLNVNTDAAVVAVYDRKGTLLKISDIQTDRYVQVNSIELSPDATRVAFTSSPGGVSILDLVRGTVTRLSRWGHTPVWSSDGARIASLGSSVPDGVDELIFSSPDGARIAYPSEGLPIRGNLLQWSNDGGFLVVESESHYAVAPMTGDRKLIPILDTMTPTTVTGLKVSPDNRLLAYQIYESPTRPSSQIWVRPFDASKADPTASAQKWLVASGRIVIGRVWWRKDGRELYYIQTGGVMAVPITASPEFKAGTPTLLFQMPPLDKVLRTRPAFRMDISPDGERFVFLLSTGGTAAAGTTAPAR
jgi:Tol biopolymer transport system component